MDRNKKYQELVEEFDKYQVEDGHDLDAESNKLGDEDTHVLRSGTRFPFVPDPTQTPTTSTNVTNQGLLTPLTTAPTQQPLTQTTSMTGGGQTPTTSGGAAGGTNSSSVVQAPIKVLHTPSVVREFSNEDPDFPASEFIGLCEDVMQNSSITDPVDKIAFVRSNVKPGSPASRLMQANVMKQPLLRKDYDEFRMNFLDVFGDDTQNNLVKGVDASLDRCLAGVGSQSESNALYGSTKVSEDMRRYLKSGGWVQNDQMSLDQVVKTYEFFTYMMLLETKKRKASLGLTFSPTDQVHEFASKLRTKLKEKQGEARLTSSVAASQVTSGVAALESSTPSYAAATSASQPTVTCTYCFKEGHTSYKCPKRKRDRRKVGGSSEASASPSFSPKSHRDNRPSKDDGTRRPAPRGQGDATRKQNTGAQSAPPRDVYCQIHDSNTHSINDCYSVARMRKEVQDYRNHRQGGSSSGEASRPRKYDPP